MRIRLRWSDRASRKFSVNFNLGAEARHAICPVYEQCLPPWSLLANYERITGNSHP